MQAMILAHRGASAYAPENTMPAFELALRQGADGIELDLHATNDGALVCLHDRSLERTTNVTAVFAPRPCWFVHEFSLAEIQTLDCGGWFGPAFAGARVPTFDEALDWAKDRTQLLVELKHPEAYEPLGIDLLSLFDGAARRHGLLNGRHREVSVQSFHEPTVRRAGALYRGRMPVGFLRQTIDAIACATPDRFAEIATFATAFNPEKDSLELRGDLIAMAHQHGLRVTPWTFRTPTVGRFGSVRAEIQHYLTTLRVDGVITDNPDEGR